MVAVATPDLPDHGYGPPTGAILDQTLRRSVESATNVRINIEWDDHRSLTAVPAGVSEPETARNVQ